MLHIAGGHIVSLPGPRSPARRNPSSSGSNKENQPPAPSSTQALGRRARGSDSDGDDARDNLSWAPRKKAARTDPLVGHGRHFGRTIHAFCRPFPLIKEGLSRQLQLQAAVIVEDELSDQEQREHAIFKSLLSLSPGLDARILKASADELHYVADMINKGSTGARSDDTKALKSVIIDWITPHGGALSPPLSRNVKTDRGFFHNRTGELLCPATLDWSDSSRRVREELRTGELAVTGDIWPAFLYQNHKFNPENPWDGLFQGTLLVSAYKHVFTSPSSVDQEIRATRSGNAEIHGMKCVTIASIAYIATLVRFSLSSSAVFCRNDRATDSERFYKSIVEFLESPSELEEVQDLVNWWNRKIFPSHHACSSSGKAAIPSVVDALKEWREKKRLALSDRSNMGAQPDGGAQEPSP